MGVDIGREQLGTRLLTGATKLEHAELAKEILDKVVAIDIAAWLYASDGNAQRNQVFAQQHPEDPELAFQNNAADLLIDRLIQLVKYGAHPVAVCLPRCSANSVDTCTLRARVVIFACLRCKLHRNRMTASRRVPSSMHTTKCTCTQVHAAVVDHWAHTVHPTIQHVKGNMLQVIDGPPPYQKNPALAKRMQGIDPHSTRQMTKSRKWEQADFLVSRICKALVRTPCLVASRQRVSFSLFQQKRFLPP